MGSEQDVAVAPSTGRDAFAVLAGRLSRILGACELETLDTAVEECLEQLGRHAGVDVAFALLADDDERVAEDWCWVGVDRSVEQPEPGSPLRNTFGSAIEILRLGHTVAVDDLAELDLGPSERALADRNRLRSIVTAPVRVGGTLLGITGLQVLDRPHHWTRAEVGQLELIAELLVKAIVRTHDRGALAAANARARRIADFLPDGLLLLDPAGIVTFASRSFARAAGIAADQIVATSVATLVHPDDQELFRATMASNVHLGSGLVIRMRAPAGWCWSELSWQLVHEPESGVPDEVVVSVRDVHDKHLQIEDLARQHERDPLTGLLDRRGLERTIAELARAETTVLIGFIDIDRFKAVNDHHGHGAGDDVLRLVAAALLEAVRRGDVVARVGGDEFCVVARSEGAWREGPVVLGERLRAAVAACAFPHPPVTVSIGIAGPDLASAAERLRSGADAAMYEAKRAGGGRFAVAGS